MASDTLFRQKAPEIMRLLMADFGLTVEDAAAILGNLGHESGGFKFLQEKKPLVKGSRGGWGWAQWTGPRRKAFEAYCKRNDLDPASDKANYGWLFVELNGAEAGAIPAVKKAQGLEEKVKAFEAAFERAGVKHYPSRLTWAKKALAAFEAAAARPAPTPTPAPTIEAVVHQPHTPIVTMPPVRKPGISGKVFGGLAGLAGAAAGVFIGSATGVDLGGVWDVFEPFAAELLSALLLALLGWAVAAFQRWTGIKIEEKHQRTLHSAAVSGLNLGLAKIGGRLDGKQINVGSPVLAVAIEHMTKVAPDAMAHFNLKPETLFDFVLAKVPQVLGVTSPPAR